MIFLCENEKGQILQETRFSRNIMLQNETTLRAFIKTKELEGCSKTTLTSYTDTIRNLSIGVGKPYELMTTVDIRGYMSNYQMVHRIKNHSMDNIRRIFSSFYNFLSEEDYLIHNPIKKIHRIKSEKTIQYPFSDEEIITIQDACRNLREKAIVDFLYSTGVRVSELCQMNRSDINLANREGIVFGKGAKERIIYIDARTKVHVQQYLDKRTDTNDALFVTAIEPYDRLTKTGVEYIIGNIGMRTGIEKCHPHRFRRTLATRLIDRGVPIEQVQVILGHSKIETTTIYAQVNQSNVKMNHNKFV